MNSHISIVIPTRNEEKFIEKCLNSILNQTLSNTEIEIIVVDGMSTDQTQAIVKHLSETRSNSIKLLLNHKEKTPYAMNIGFQRAKGDILFLIGGHCEIAPDYLERCLEILEETGAGCVGGPLKNQGETYWAKAIALAMSSPFGVGNALFRYADSATEVDTVAFGAYRREVVEKVGLFNEELTRNQDDEYNYRVRAAGYKIWLDPRIRSTYYTRSNLRSLWKQYFQYGYFKVKVMRIYPKSIQIRHLVPGLFVLALTASSLLSFITPWGLAALLLILLPYLSLNIFFSLRQSSQQFNYLIALIIIFPTLHLAYGCGFWFGLIQAILHPKKPI